jgi:hypothetical protein
MASNSELIATKKLRQSAILQEKSSTQLQGLKSRFISLIPSKVLPLVTSSTLCYLNVFIARLGTMNTVSFLHLRAKCL